MKHFLTDNAFLIVDISMAFLYNLGTKEKRQVKKLS